MQSKYCIEVTVKGKVQRVFFRQSTQNKARDLGLTGWVKNNTDGSVLLRACGEKEPINQLVEWLKTGPPLAKVSTIDTKEVSVEHFHGFEVRPTV